MPDTVPFPHPWSEDTIGSKAEVTVGGTPSTAVARYWGGTVPWMSSGDVHLRRISDVPGRITEAGLRASAAKMVEPPAVAIALAGQGKTRGTPALTEITLCTNQSVALIRPRDEELDARYLYYSLDYRYEELRARSAGGGRAGLTKQIVQDVPVPLPHPNEQSHIAEILDTLDAAIRETEAVVAKLRQVKAGLLHDLLTRGLDEHGHLRDPARHPEQFQDSLPGLLPVGWEIQTLDQITDPIAPICYGIVQVFDFIPNGILVLAIRDILGDYATDIHRTLPSIDANYTRSRVRPDDVLISIKGTIGRIGIVPSHYVGNISRDLARIRPVKWVKPRFLLHLLRSPGGQKTLELTQVGTTRAELSIAPLKCLKFAFPPTEEQQRIASILDEHDQLIVANEVKLGKLHFLKRGLAHDLLTGRVRVTPVSGESG